MFPLSRLSADEARRIDGLLFDLDDTLLDHGTLTEAAYTALWRLRRSGLFLMGVTGRPAGWGAVLVRQWPVDAMVTENGAIALQLDGRGVRTIDSVPPEQRRERRGRLVRLVSELSLRFDGLLPADDVDARITDYTFDIGERQSPPRELVQDAIRFARERGFRTMTSSVHLHVTLEADDKATGALRVLRALRGVDVTAARSHFAYVGDSENDAACFACFATTFGVANLSGLPSLRPRYGTSEPRGAGFAELADRLLELRR